MLSADLVTPRQGCQWKWYKMVEINCVFRHDKNEGLWLKSLCTMSNAKVFTGQDGRMDKQMDNDDQPNTTDYID